MFKSIFIWVALGTAGLAGTGSAAYARDFWTPQALLSQHFHGSERVSFVRLRLVGPQRSRVESRLGRALPKAEYTVFVATTGGRADGYAVFDEQLGQHEPISFATFFDAEGRITRIEVVAYREPFGEGIRAERFRRQFIGRSVRSQFRAGSDIDIISGATISSRSMCIGVERAAALLDEALRSQGSLVLATR
jgi:electron transport complex protein RnfG